MIYAQGLVSTQLSECTIPASECAPKPYGLAVHQKGSEYFVTRSLSQMRADLSAGAGHYNWSHRSGDTLHGATPIVWVKHAGCDV